jgi:hypothetical protein
MYYFSFYIIKIFLWLFTIRNYKNPWHLWKKQNFKWRGLNSNQLAKTLTFHPGFSEPKKNFNYIKRKIIHIFLGCISVFETSFQGLFFACRRTLLFLAFHDAVSLSCYSKRKTHVVLASMGNLKKYVLFFVLYN